MKKPQRDVLIQNVEDPSTTRVVLQKVEEVDEDAVLTNGFGAALPGDELELGDTKVRSRS